MTATRCDLCNAVVVWRGPLCADDPHGIHRYVATPPKDADIAEAEALRARPALTDYERDRLRLVTLRMHDRGVFGGAL